MILLILGTRPEAIKLRPLILELKHRKKAFRVIATGQHKDLLEGTGVKPDTFLQVESRNDPMEYVDRCVATLSNYLTKHVARASSCSWIVVQGDTASALAGARWASAAGIPVCHVEAGLRSGCLDDPWPEEGFRIEIDRLAELHCAPTDGNTLNLDAEGLNNTFKTGNTITDSLRLMGVSKRHGSHVLVTLHRRESFGQPLRNILSGLCHFAVNHPLTPILWPTHPNPKVHEAIQAFGGFPTNILRRTGLPYRDFLTLLSSAKAVLTDSGGVLEEATTLGIPCAIARNHTERPESLQIGSAHLAGSQPDSVSTGLEWAFTAEIEPSAIYGDGHASEKICDLLHP